MMFSSCGYNESIQVVSNSAIGVNQIILRLEQQIKPTIDYLSSDEAQRSFDADPYWPKWNSPWWHMTLLWELGAADRIPKRAIDRMLDALTNRYIHFFPFVESEVPPGVDPLNGVMCHCGLGTMYQVLRAAGVDVDSRFPWVRKWIVQYQMDEGGWNCDEGNYVKESPKSSIVSSVPIIESLLSIPDRTSEEDSALDKGIEYLLARRLFRARTTGSIIDESWTQLTFPRFYGYDILRGLSVVTRWSRQRNKRVPQEAIEEALGIIEGKVITKNDYSGLPVEFEFYKSCGSRVLGDDGKWTKGDSTDFPLLRWCSQVGEISPSLTAAWDQVLKTTKSPA